MSQKIKLMGALSSGMVLVGLASYVLLSNKVMEAIHKKASSQKESDRAIQKSFRECNSERSQESRICRPQIRTEAQNDKKRESGWEKTPHGKSRTRLLFVIPRETSNLLAGGGRFLVSLGMTNKNLFFGVRLFPFGEKTFQHSYNPNPAQESLSNPPSLLTRLVDARKPSDWARYFKKGRLLGSRMVLIGLSIQFALLLLEHHQKTRLYVNNFFTAKAHPINLAIFRIGFFWYLFKPSRHGLAWYGQIPAEFRVAPLGAGWLIETIPLNERTIRRSSFLFRLFCLTGMIGFFTRTSAFLATILGLYVLGVRHFFGRVNHDQHLFWFLGILSASRSADVFSFDALLAAWKRAEHGMTAPPSASQLYALPLRFIWLLFGIIFFFPGFWKFWESGFDWALSDNIKYIALRRRAKLTGWEPILKIDEYPLLYKVGGLMTILFEIGFVLLIFLPRGRGAAFLGGLTFHKMTKLSMDIGFASLRKCYIAFVDWHSLFIAIGRRLYQEPMTVIYHGDSLLSRRTIACLRVFDVFERVTYVDARDEAEAEALLALGSDTLTSDILATKGEKRWHGLEVTLTSKVTVTSKKGGQALAARIPILWPLLPFLYLWPIPTIVKQLYRQWVESQSAHQPPLATRSGKDDCEASPRDNSQRSIVAIYLIGTLLLIVNALFGMKKITQGWPFACYPAFSGIAKPTIQTLKTVPLSSTGEPISYNEQKLVKRFSVSRFFPLSQHILKSQNDPQHLQSRLKALWQWWTQNEPTLQQAVSVRFYEETLTVIPERKAENPLQQKLLFELNLREDA